MAFKPFVVRPADNTTNIWITHISKACQSKSKAELHLLEYQSGFDSDVPTMHTHSMHAFHTAAFWMRFPPLGVSSWMNGEHVCNM